MHCDGQNDGNRSLRVSLGMTLKTNQGLYTHLRIARILNTSIADHADGRSFYLVDDSANRF